MINEIINTNYCCGNCLYAWHCSEYAHLMPYSAPKPCTYPLCKALATNGTSRCTLHPYPKNNRKTTEHLKLYKSSSWIKLRKAYLLANPICVICKAKGIRTPANTVDHKIPHKGNRKLFFNQRNWQPLCRSCHSRKTASQDGGFGNVRK